MGDKDDVRIGISKLEDRLGIHRSTVARWIREGTFPASHYIGSSRMWWLSEVAKWERAEQQRATERAATKRGRLDPTSPKPPKAA